MARTELQPNTAPEPQYPTSYSDFPDPTGNLGKPEEVAINQRIDQLRRATRDEIVEAIKNRALKNRSPRIAAEFLPDPESTDQPGQSLKLSQEEITKRLVRIGILHKKPGEPEAWSRTSHKNMLKYYLKRTNAELGASGLLVAHLPTPKTDLAERRYQIESGAIQVPNNLNSEIQIAHREANIEKQPTLRMVFKAKHLKVLKVLVHQFWGVETGDLPNKAIETIEEINKIAEEEGLLFRIAIRNNLAVITCKDGTIQVPSLEPSRNQLPIDVQTKDEPIDLEIQEPLEIPTPETLKLTLPIPAETPVEELTQAEKEYLLLRLRLLTTEDVEEYLEDQPLGTGAITPAILHFMQNTQAAPLSSLEKIYTKIGRKGRNKWSNIKQSLDHEGFPPRKLKNPEDKKDPLIVLMTKTFKETTEIPRELMLKHETAKKFEHQNLSQQATKLLHTLAHKYFGIMLDDNEENQALVEEINQAISELELKIYYRNGIAILNFTLNFHRRNNPYPVIPNPKSHITTPEENNIPRPATKQELETELKKIHETYPMAGRWVKRTIELEKNELNEKWRKAVRYRQANLRAVSEGLEGTRLTAEIDWNNEGELVFIFHPAKPETPQQPRQETPTRLERRVQELEKEKLEMLLMIQRLQETIQKLTKQIEAQTPTQTLKKIDSEKQLTNILKDAIRDILKIEPDSQRIPQMRPRIGELKKLTEAIAKLQETEMPEAVRTKCTETLLALREMIVNQENYQRLTRRQVQKIIRISNGDLA